MLWLNDFVAALSLSQLALLVAYFAIKFKGHLARLISLYSFCLGAYLLATMSIAKASPVATFILFRLATLAPILLWFIAYSMFEDNRKKLPIVWIAIAFMVLARGLGMSIAMFNPGILADTLGYTLILFLPQIVLLLFSFHTAYLAWADYHIDLLEQRRRVRLVFVVVMGVIVISIVGTDFIMLSGRYIPIGWLSDLLPIPGILVSSYILVAAFLLNMRIFRLDDRALFILSKESNPPAEKIVPGAIASEPESENVSQLASLMRDQKLYIQPGLTIADLANALKMQEYRVRRLINQQLGFRNFNQFLNNYRIEDARNRLLETESAISNIALDVGYASLSVFNKAFKDRYNLTPREYRVLHKESIQKAESPA